MQGQTECLSSADTIPCCYEYKWLDDALVPLKNPVGEDITYNKTRGEAPMKGMDFEKWLSLNALGSACFGHTNLVPEFCRAYHEISGHSVIAVHASKGSTVIADWLPEERGFEFIEKKSLAAVQKAKEKYKIGKIFFVWLQGESDAIEGNQKQYYKEKITELCAHLKKRIGIDRFGIIRVGRFTNDKRDDEIIDAQDEVCNENPDFVMLTREAAALNEVPEYMNPEYEGHFSAKGLELLGRLAGTKLAQYK